MVDKAQDLFENYSDDERKQAHKKGVDAAVAAIESGAKIRLLDENQVSGLDLMERIGWNSQVTKLNPSEQFIETDKVFICNESLYFTDSGNEFEYSISRIDSDRVQLYLTLNSLVNVHLKELQIHSRPHGPGTEFELNTRQLKIFISKASFDAIRDVFPSIPYVEES